jgi:hypothetical protein
MASTIQVFVPVGVVAAATARDSAASRPDQSDFIIGMLDNHKHGTAQILDRLQQRLTEQFGEVRFVRHKKGDAGRGAGQKIIDELARQCGVVVNGVAD